MMRMTKVNDSMSSPIFPSPYITRQFNLADLDEVVRINQLCLPENYPKSFFTQVYSTIPEAFRVAVDNDKIIGYVMTRLEEPFHFFKRDRKKRGHIISVAVLPSYRRLGLARRMIIESLEMLRKYKAHECYLEVRRSNLPAISLYEGLGFHQTRVIPRYYKDGEAALVMTKHL